ncbi:MAG: 30S ribosomal protein S1 [Bacteroidetes bacterium]|nr:30S ribosomal protein S1 [Bacteroidota bacterium]MBS1741323.1 30S ribosomal protein S1 [Bacteroidota bacterium]
MLEENQLTNTQNQHPVTEEQTQDVQTTTKSKNEPKIEVTAHDDFDWSVDKRNVATYSNDKREQMEKVYDNTFKQVSDSELLIGTIVGLTKTDAIVNIGFKSDGLISLNEFRDMPNVKNGDEVEVMVVEKEDRNGHLHLSRKLARATRSWQQIVEFYKTGEIVTGTITSKTKGGLIVDVHGLETFLPGSQIDVKPVTDYDQYVGKTMDFKVVKINEAIRNAVVSHKALIESDIEQQRSVIIGQLEKGQVLEGIVKNVTDFGAFIDLGGVDGLLYITDISWGRINHPTEVLENGQKLNVVVLDFDDEKKRISLGLKQLTPHPWDNLSDDIKEGSKVKGKVVNIEDYGAFLEILPGVEGLVHVSEITWSSQPINAKEFFKMGDEYEAMVVTLDKDERKMSLSIKQLTEDPWETIENKFPIDSRHKGVVKNITPYGVFVELESGIGGMIHISDLSWIKRFNHPSEFTKTGEEIEVTILGIDKENRKLSLGHKQLEEDPWNTFETVFPIGSIHEGHVTRKDDKGAMVQLQYGLEAYAPIRHLRKEDGSNVENDETLPFMIIEFDRNDKRILVSHSRVWEQTKAEEKETVRKAARAEDENTKKAVKNVQSKVEKPTLGDLGALAALKDKMKKAEDDSEK